MCRGGLPLERFRRDTNNRRNAPDIGADCSERALHRSLNEVKTLAAGLRTRAAKKTQAARSFAAKHGYPFNQTRGKTATDYHPAGITPDGG